MGQPTNKRGFTLVEILVTIVIIGALTAISTFAYFGLQAQGRDKVRQTNASIIADQLEDYYDTNGEYPSVPSIVGQPGPTVTAKLKLKTSEVLVLPQAPTGTTNSLTQSESSPTQLAYNGASSQTESGSCEDDINGGCDSFNLQWQTEGGESLEIPSRHGNRLPIGGTGVIPATPNAPVMSGSITAQTAVATASSVTCAAGSTPEYRIVQTSNTTGDEPVFPDWSTVNWSTKRSVTTTATEGTHYYFKAVARCVNQSGASESSNESNVIDLYYANAGAPTIDASISDITISVSVSPITCPVGSTAKYQILEKKDTPSGAGTMSVVATRDFTTASTYTTTAGGPPAPTKHTFRAYTRCDSGASQGSVSPASADTFVISAPRTPTLSNNAGSNRGTSNSVTWAWAPGGPCPVGTTTIYQPKWDGDYVNAGQSIPIANTATTVTQTTSSQGYSYGVKISASCGTPIQDRVLVSPPIANQNYLRNIEGVIWVYKGSIRTRRLNPQAQPTVVFAQSIIHSSRTTEPNVGYQTTTPNMAYPVAGNCPTGLTRMVRWQWSLDSPSYGYKDASGPVDNDALSPWYVWANNTSRMFPIGATNADFTNEGMRDLGKNPNYTSSDPQGNNSKVGFRFHTVCRNTSNGNDGTINSAAPFGTITTLEHDGRFHNFCEADMPVPWCKAWHTPYNPLSGHQGEWAAHNGDTGTCIGGGLPDDKYCFSPIYNANSAPWGW